MHLNKQHSAGWSSLEARRAHNPKAAGSNPAPATNVCNQPFLFYLKAYADYNKSGSG